MTEQPQIVESYHNFTPPFNIARTVRLLLRYVPPEYLAGLKTIVLTDSQGGRSFRRGKTWSRGRKVSLAASLGLYREQQIRILVDNVLNSMPHNVRRWGYFRLLVFGSVLYHELGHHIHTTQRPAYGEPEEEADRLGRHLLGLFLRRRYWYLMPFRRPLRYLALAYKRIKEKGKPV